MWINEDWIDTTMTMKNNNCATLSNQNIYQQYLVYFGHFWGHFFLNPLKTILPIWLIQSINIFIPFVQIVPCGHMDNYVLEVNVIFLHLWWRCVRKTEFERKKVGVKTSKYFWHFFEIQIDLVLYFVTIPGDCAFRYKRPLPSLCTRRRWASPSFVW